MKFFLLISLCRYVHNGLQRYYRKVIRQLKAWWFFISILMLFDGRILSRIWTNYYISRSGSWRPKNFRIRNSAAQVLVWYGSEDQDPDPYNMSRIRNIASKTFIRFHSWLLRPAGGVGCSPVRREAVHPLRPFIGRRHCRHRHY